MRDPMIERCEWLLDVRRAVRRLTPKQRQTLYYWLAGYTQQEIAALVGVTQSAICQRLQTIMEVIRGAI